MKRLIIGLSAIVALMALTLTLASCGGGLSGTYGAEGGNFSGVSFNEEPLVSVEFKAFGEAEIVTGGFSRTTYEDGSYKIDGNRITLKAEWNIADKWEGSYSYSQSGNTIEIDGHPFTKH
jgi:large exoprotein involved in heme utilization and adhesion